MFIGSRPRTVATISTLLLCAAAGSRAFGAAPAAFGATPERRSSAPQRFGIRTHPLAPFVVSRRASSSGSGQTYTINDVGTPPSSLYSTSEGPPGPLGFNNTGQIFGTAYKNSKPHSQADCIVYTDGAFVDPSTSPYTYQCSLYSINDASSSGAFEVGGALESATNPDLAALIVNGSNTSKSLSVVGLGAADPRSGIVGVDAAGIGLGYTYGAGNNDPPKTYSPTTKHYTAIQPKCTALNATTGGCFESIVFTYGPLVPCPFGGCYINNNGTALGSSPAYGGTFGLYALSTGAWVDLPATFSDSYASYYINSVPMITNYGAVAVADIDNGGPPGGPYVTIYPFSSNSWRRLPALASKCPQHNVLSMNNEGEVLGFDTGCSSGNDVYWTWDPASGIQAVNIPANSYNAIQLLGVNDNGQILATLQTGAGAYDWGTLNPVGGGHSSVRRRAHTAIHHLGHR